MKAKEMFEKMGWKIGNNINYQHLILYFRETPQHKQRISFDTKKRKFSCTTLEDNYIKKGLRLENQPMHIDIHTFKAIQKQIEELGW